MSEDDYLSPEMQKVALDAQVGCNTWDVAEHIGIAQEVLLHVVERLKAQAVERFDRCGFMDPRGAAIWDCAGFVNETLIGDPLRRRFAVLGRYDLDRVAPPAASSGVPASDLPVSSNLEVGVPELTATEEASPGDTGSVGVPEYGEGPNLKSP